MGGLGFCTGEWGWSNHAKVMMVVALATHMTLRNDADEETLKAVAFSGYMGKDLPPSFTDKICHLTLMLLF